MKLKSLLAQIALGEDSFHQFRADVKNADSLASEMAAFANSKGGMIIIGVADDGSTPGLSGQDVARLNQLIRNAASHLVRSPLAVQTENVALEKWPAIDFTDDHDGCLFTATVHRKPVEELELVDKGAIRVQDAPIKASLSDLQVQFFDFIRSNRTVSYDELADMTQKDRTTVMRNIGKLRDAGILRRVSSKKTGHWEVIE